MTIVSALVLLSIVALSNSDCLFVSSSSAMLSNYATSISSGNSATVYCLPGHVYDASGATSYTATCATGSTTNIYSSCYQNQNWCQGAINDNFPNTSSLTSGKYPRYHNAAVFLLCKGRSIDGNGTIIVAYCSSTADGSAGVWVSTGWCSGAHGVSVNFATLAFGALAFLIYKLFIYS